jgi:hypothetical protein|tara:strand:- start:401 stop:817 length:417 start_codon:yes stop_codon:yes gene_type:complete
MALFSTIKTKVTTICSDNSLINEAFNYDKPRFDKTPACTVVPSGNEALFEDTANNRRIYAFTITIFVPWDAHGATDAEDTMVDVLDSLLDDFDKDFTLTGSAIMVDAAPSAWGYQEREKLYRTAQINLKVKTLFDVTQ